MENTQKTHLEICKLLSKAESNNDLTNQTLNGIHLWPLIRTTVWRNLLSSNHKVKETKYHLQGWKLVTLILALIRNFKCVKTHNPRKKYFYCFNTSNSFVCLEDNERAYDRLVQPIEDLLEPGHELVAQYINFAQTRHSGDAYTFHMPFLYANLKYKLFKFYIKKRYPLTRQIKDYLNLVQKNLDEPLGDVTEPLIIFQYWLDFFRKYLRNIPKDTIILMFDWSSPMMIAVCQSAYEQNIKTVNIQHGKQGNNNGLYSWWKFGPPNGYTCVPKKFFGAGTKQVNLIFQLLAQAYGHPKLW